MTAMDRMREDIDVLGADSAGGETVRISRERLQHLRDIERLVLLYRDGLLIESGLQRALDVLFEARPER